VVVKMILTPDRKRDARRRVSYARHNLTGERALIAAVIGQAYTDYLSKSANERADAAAYFRSQTYRHHLTLLGLPANWMPELAYV
jgi:hypothetical protein